jgi:hypothetical protein
MHSIDLAPRGLERHCSAAEASTVNLAVQLAIDLAPQNCGHLWAFDTQPTPTTIVIVNQPVSKHAHEHRAGLLRLSYVLPPKTSKK